MSVITLAGGVSAFSSATGGKIYANNSISTTPAQVVAGNPSRQRITFHNPGTVDIFIAPAVSFNGSVSATLTPSTSSLGGCFRVFANGGTLEVSGECQGAWQAFSASATGNPLTIMDSNI